MRSRSVQDRARSAPGTPNEASVLGLLMNCIDIREKTNALKHMIIEKREHRRSYGRRVAYINAPFAARFPTYREQERVYWWTILRVCQICLCSRSDLT
jgi:hypothetical protein